MSDKDTGMLSPTIDDVDVISASPTNSSHESQESYNGSTDSSFVPIEKQTLVDAIQVVDEDKKFNQKLIDYIENTTPISSIEDNYHIISVFGSQSTGKSTLLNRLFNTNFDVMDETRRQQTTKGIWLAYSPAVNSNKKLHKKQKVENIFVMDVEGTDGRERGEDQDFERKSALFALSTSEVLIINIWETQIGLYQGANMGLLKTVFEVNLSLFGKNKLNNSEDKHKVLLLFVIRDHIGVTPVENLATTVTTDLVKMWDGLSKPLELQGFKFDDFFDIKFHALGHKVLQQEKFEADIKLLGDKFIDPGHEEYVWKPNYHHDLPIDGWTMYANNCWDQIDSNKDLDLPTQQILVAKFKCDEIVSNLYEEFLVKYQELLVKPSSTTSGSSIDEDKFKEVGLLMKDLKQDYLGQFTMLAARYNSSVYQQKRQALNEKILTKYQELFNVYSKAINASLIKSFKQHVSKASESDEKYIDVVNKIKLDVVNQLTSSLTLLSIDEINFDDNIASFIEEVNDTISKQQVIELNAIVTKLVKKVSNQVNKYILFEIADFNENSWDTILRKFLESVDKALASYKTEDGYDFGLGVGQEVTKESVTKFKFKSWSKFYSSIQKNLSRDNILNILKDKFDDKFRYDDNGVPRLYSTETELDSSYNKAKYETYKLVPLLTIVKLNDSSEIVPEYDIFDESLRKKYEEPSFERDDDDDDKDDGEEFDSNKFSHIISENEKVEMLNKFKKEIDARYIETKRSIVSSVTSIPYYIYLIIVVLGWNEFMAVIRSPIFFTLALLLGGITYVMYQLNLIKPAMQVGNKMVQESITLGKQKLKEFLIDENELHRRNLDKISNNATEDIELTDLSEERR